MAQQLGSEALGDMSNGGMSLAPAGMDPAHTLVNVTDMQQMPQMQHMQHMQQLQVQPQGETMSDNETDGEGVDAHLTVTHEDDGSGGMRTCSICKELKETKSFYSYKPKERPTRRFSDACSECIRRDNKEWYMANKDTSHRDCSKCKATLKVGEFYIQNGVKWRQRVTASCKKCTWQRAVWSGSAARKVQRRRQMQNPNPTVEVKRCSKCTVTKPASEFHRDKYMSDGLYIYCKACTKARKQQRKEDKAAARQAAGDSESLEVKDCKQCQKPLPMTSFYRNKDCKDGRSKICKDCYKHTHRYHVTEPTVTERECKGCSTIKHARDFYRNPSRCDGLARLCKECTRAAKKTAKNGVGIDDVDEDDVVDNDDMMGVVAEHAGHAPDGGAAAAQAQMAAQGMAVMAQQQLQAMAAQPAAAQAQMAAAHAQAHMQAAMASQQLSSQQLSSQQLAPAQMQQMAATQIQQMAPAQVQQMAGMQHVMQMGVAGMSMPMGMQVPVTVQVPLSMAGLEGLSALPLQVALQPGAMQAMQAGQGGMQGMQLPMAVAGVAGVASTDQQAAMMQAQQQPTGSVPMANLGDGSLVAQVAAAAEGDPHALAQQHQAHHVQQQVQQMHQQTHQVQHTQQHMQHMQQQAQQQVHQMQQAQQQAHQMQQAQQQAHQMQQAQQQAHHAQQQAQHAQQLQQQAQHAAAAQQVQYVQQHDGGVAQVGVVQVVDLSHLAHGMPAHDPAGQTAASAAAPTQHTPADAFAPSSVLVADHQAAPAGMPLDAMPAAVKAEVVGVQGNGMVTAASDGRLSASAGGQEDVLQ